MEGIVPGDSRRSHRPVGGLEHLLFSRIIGVLVSKKLRRCAIDSLIQDSARSVLVVDPHSSEPEKGDVSLRHASPILRWVGGKTQILAFLTERLPNDVNDRFYAEPFFGGGALFFSVRPEGALLSDSNRHLLDVYKQVRDHPNDVATELERHASRSSEAYYYEIRRAYNKSAQSAVRAAQFIYLNKSCFNGVFRVNRADEFNVPYGWKEPPHLPSREELCAVAVQLRAANLICCDFEEAARQIPDSSFVYFDPPYPSINGTRSFVRYTPNQFSEDDHRRLASAVRRLDRHRCFVMVSNADTPLVRKLYAGFNFSSVDVIRHVTCKGETNRTSELLITNY